MTKGCVIAVSRQTAASPAEAKSAQARLAGEAKAREAFFWPMVTGW